MAATGAIRDARRAGLDAANSVTIVPSSTVTTIVRVDITSPPEGNPRSSASSSAYSPVAMPRPAATPRALPTSPTTLASNSTDRRT